MSSRSTARSSQFDRRARELTPGGVHSNVRLSAPRVFFERAQGAWLFDVDGNDYVDHLLGQGPNFLGHAPPTVVEAVAEACQAGTLYGGQHPLEVEAGAAVLDLLGWAEAVRFGVSGTEMVHEALRVARAVTGRSKFVRFEGHYHGWLDNVLIADHGDHWGPASAGQDAADLAGQFIIPWNDPDALRMVFDRHGAEIAAVITEPMMVNVGAILPDDGFLELIRSITLEHDALLIFDEVITGFRLAAGGAAERFGVIPDLATYGKAIAAGWPVAAVAGSGRVMERIGTGEINHSGTFNSSVMSMAAVVATARELTASSVHDDVERQGSSVRAGVAAVAERHGLRLRIGGLGAAFHVGVQRPGADQIEVRDARSLGAAVDAAQTTELCRVIVDHGIWVAMRGVWYTGAAHGHRELDEVLDRLDRAFGAFAARLG